MTDRTTTSRRPAPIELTALVAVLTITLLAGVAAPAAAQTTATEFSDTTGSSLPRGDGDPQPLPEVPVDPIVPSTGEQQLIDLLAMAPLQSHAQPLDNFPLPFAIVAIAGDGAPVVVNGHAGAPIQVDVDNDKATGKGGGGNDLRIELNTEPFPVPHLVLEVERLGGAPFVEAVTLLVSVPWNAFNDESLPGRPNLFFGFRTTDEFDAVVGGYPYGGHAPSLLTMSFTPGLLAAADHDLLVEIATTGSDNPLRLLAGHFDGTDVTGQLNAFGLGAHADPVPETIRIGLDVANTALFQPTFATSFELDWQASEPSRVEFDFIENEDFPFDVSHFGTSLLVEAMPTQELLSLTLDTDAATAVIGHRADAPVGSITLRHRRADELTVVGVASEVPTEVDLTLDLAGAATLDVNDNTLDIDLQIVETGGFPGTDAFLGYDVDYVAFAAGDVPDVTVGFDPVDDAFGAAATNPGECAGCDTIGFVSLILDDDGRLDDDDAPLNLALPASWAETPSHDIFSLVDDGTHGTAAGRLVTFASASYRLLATDIGELWHLETTAAAPLQAYLRTKQGSNLIPGHDVEITCDVDDIPAGTVDFDVDFPYQFSYTIDPPQGIDALACKGHIDSLNFDVEGADLPPVFGWDFDPDDHLIAIAEDGSGPNSDEIGLFRARFWDEQMPLPGSGALFGEGLQDARSRIDHVPSFESSWLDTGGATQIVFDTGSPVDALLYLGGAQLAVATDVVLTDDLVEPDALTPQYARFEDQGPGGTIEMRMGVFDMDQAAYVSVEGGGQRTVTAFFEAETSRQLSVTFDSTFGGVFFPDYEIQAAIQIADLPTSFALATDLATHYEHTGSAGFAQAAVIARIDTTDDQDGADAVDIDLRGEAVPAAVTFDIDPASGATLSMNAGADSVRFLATSGAPIFASPFRLIDARLTDIPAKWIADWSGSLRLETLNAVDGPAPLGLLEVELSNSTDPQTNTDRLESFAVAGTSVPGTVVPGGAACRIEYTPFLQEIDRRYSESGNSPGVLTRLRRAYCGGTGLVIDPEVQDHAVVVEGDDIEYVSAQLAGFQLVDLTVDGDQGAIELNVPSDGPHPFFVGYEAGEDSAAVAIENVPDTVTAAYDLAAGSFDLNTAGNNGSFGRLDVYLGPLPFAANAAAATRIVIDDVPNQVEATWDIGEHGTVTLESSSPFELAFLDQDAGERIVAGVAAQDFELGWDAEIIAAELEIDVFDLECIDFNIIPLNPADSCGNVFFIFADVGLDVVSFPGADGFFHLYNRINNPKPLAIGGPAADLQCGTGGEQCWTSDDCDGPGTCRGDGTCAFTGADCGSDADCEDVCVGGEYVPRVTVAARNMLFYDGSVDIRQCLQEIFAGPVPPAPCSPLPGAIGIEVSSGPSQFGQLLFDFWDLAEIPEITGSEDYRGNSPWHFISPLGHDFSDHFDPFE